MTAALLASIALAGFAPYGPAAFREAARGARPVLLVVRDSYCTACRAPEEAAFADPAIAPLLRDGYLLVEAEALDRPDVADLASLALTTLDAPGSGEGPTLLLLTPAGKPFAGRSGIAPAEDLRAFLRGGHAEFRNARSHVEARAARVVAALRRAQGPSGPPAPLAEPLVAAVVRRLQDAHADALGGAARLFLLAHHARTDDRAALALIHDAPAPAPSASLAEAALRIEGAARAARARDDAPGRAAARAAATQWAAALPAEGELPAGPDGVAADLGVVLQALAGAAQVLEAPELLAPAQRLAAAVVTRLGPVSALRHRVGGDGPGTLDDHAHLALGLLALDEASGETRWRDEVVRLVEAALGRFGDVEGGAFFATAEATEPLDLRTRTAFDARLPSGNGTLVRVLLRLARATGEARHRDLARRTLEWLAPALGAAPRGMETVALAADEFLGDAAVTARDVGPSASPSPGAPPASPVRARAVLSRDAVRPGETVSAQVRLEVPAGWSVVAPEGRRPLFGFALSVPGTLVPAGRPVYPASGEVPAAGAAPAFPALFGGVEIRVPLRVPADLPAGPSQLLLRLRYQACQGPHCLAPDGTTLSVPFIVLPAMR